MSLYDPSSRYRRRAAERKRKTTTFIVFLFLFAAFFYWVGGQVVRSSEVAYKQRATELKDEKKELENRLTSTDADMQTLKMEYEKLENKYNEEVPKGELKELAELAKTQLDDGIGKDRLEFVIQSARPPRNCTKPETKRFVARTPFYRGPDSFVAFVGGSMTITGAGEAATRNGQPEAWYDPGKPVKINFTRIGGKKVEKEGLLPIHYSIVAGDKEHRFTIAKGKRSFINVTSDSCDYP